VCEFQSESLRCGSLYYTVISINFGCYQSIIDRYSVFLEIHLSERSCPFVVSSKFYFFTCGHITGIKFCFYKFWTDCILVVCIVPVNRCFDICHCWYMSCCNGKSGSCISCDFCSISVFATLKADYFDCINNFLTSFVLAKSGPCLGPFGFLIDCNHIAEIFVISFKL